MNLKNKAVVKFEGGGHFRQVYYRESDVLLAVKKLKEKLSCVNPDKDTTMTIHLKKLSEIIDEELK